MTLAEAVGALLPPSPPFDAAVTAKVGPGRVWTITVNGVAHVGPDLASAVRAATTEKEIAA